jgi:hypothetical protein
MVIVNVKISVDENYTTQVVIQIKIYIKNAIRTKSGWKFLMQRDRVTGFVNMGVHVIQYLYLPVENVLPQLPSFPKCVAVSALLRF